MPATHEVHDVAFVALEKEPAAQLVQTRLFVAVPAVLTKVPAAHVVHVVHVVFPVPDA